MSLIKNISRFLLFLAAAALMSSCIEESLLPECGNGNEGPEGINGTSDYSLMFKIGLQTLGAGSRSIDDINEDAEKYEDYIDVNKLYIMFFLEGEDSNQEKQDMLYKMFAPGDPSVSLIPVGYNTNDQYDKSWFVRISIPDIKDEGNNEIGERFAEVLRNNDFRIAVIANADPNKKIVMQEATYDETGNFTLGSNIQDLHRQTDGNDLYVKDTKNDDESVKVDADLRALYGFMYENRKNDNGKFLGYYTNWVQNNSTDINGESNAAKYIRNNYGPISWEENKYRFYTNLWQVWNFGGGDANNALPYPKTEDKDYTLEWETVNGEYLREVLENAISMNPVENKKNEGILEGFATGPATEDETGKIIASEKIYLEYIDFVDEGTYATAIKQNASNGKFYYGVKLPKNIHGAGGTSSYVKLNPNDGGCLAFTATGRGHLIITAVPAEEGKKATVYAQIAKKSDEQKFEFTKSSPTEVSKKISITGDSQIIYIYTDSESQTAPIIYQIEFIKDTYLYETDRSGIAPSKDQPIPMYGVASYKQLRDLWEKGTSFDLDDYNGTSTNYPGANDENGSNGSNSSNDLNKSYFHPIPLLRSVAKVIVRIPKTLKPKHVYLRSVNRNARWEPADVKSNTIDIWSDGSEDFKNQHSDKCEFFNIQQQPVFYNPKITGGSYKEKLAWYYGTWMEQKIIPEITTVKTVKTDIHSSGKAFTYPRIMNALITRSDFVQFIDAGDDEGIYEKYVLYVPEKYVDDPNSFDGYASDPSKPEKSAPKVCHVEFRVGDDPIDNLDDNNCYRIYFTKDGFAEGATVPSLIDDDHGWEKSYEQDTNILAKHWPILRNHVYQFTVRDITQQAVIVSLEVLPWKKVKDIQVQW